MCQFLLILFSYSKDEHKSCLHYFFVWHENASSKIGIIHNNLMKMKNLFIETNGHLLLHFWHLLQSILNTCINLKPISSSSPDAHLIFDHKKKFNVSHNPHSYNISISNGHPTRHRLLTALNSNI